MGPRSYIKRIKPYTVYNTFLENHRAFRRSWSDGKFRTTFFKDTEFSQREHDLFELCYSDYCYRVDEELGCWAACSNDDSRYVAAPVGYARGTMIAAPFFTMVAAAILDIAGLPSEVYTSFFMVAGGLYCTHLLLCAYTWYTISWDKCCKCCSWEVDPSEQEASDLQTVELVTKKRVPNYRGIDKSSCIAYILQDYVRAFIHNHQFSWLHRAVIQLWPGFVAYCFFIEFSKRDYLSCLCVMGMAAIAVLFHMFVIKPRNYRALFREYRWAVLFCCVKKSLIEYDSQAGNEHFSWCSCCFSS